MAKAMIERIFSLLEMSLNSINFHLYYVYVCRFEQRSSLVRVKYVDLIIMKSLET